MNLNEAVERAVARLQTDGITGWGLDNPDPEVFDRVALREGRGCTDTDTCRHVSHDPWARDYRLIPVSGTLINMGDDYYVLRGGAKGDTFWYLQSSQAYHDRLSQVGAEEVPEGLLAAMLDGHASEHGER